MLAVNIDMHVGDVRITPMVAHARALVEVGTDVIELEVDVEKCRRNGQDISKLIGDMIRLGVPVKAGVGRPEDGVVAVQAGVTFVSSSTSGYTPEVEKMKLPDIRLMAALIRSVTAPVIAERGYSTPTDVRAALDARRWRLLWGSAIVDPVWPTRQIVRIVDGLAEA